MSRRKKKSGSESLGEKEIEGVKAEGRRTIVKIPVGAMANHRALEIVTERWYSFFELRSENK